jgi:type 1 fimbriae regulatory protein FimE
MTERGAPMTAKAFHALFGRIGARAKMPFPIHPHMLRHGCGYALANAGHDTRALQAYLGHKNIQHTVRYTELAADRFRNFGGCNHPPCFSGREDSAGPREPTFAGEAAPRK